MANRIRDEQPSGSGNRLVENELEVGLGKSTWIFELVGALDDLAEIFRELICEPGFEMDRVHKRGEKMMI